VWIKEDDILFVEAFGKKIALNTNHGTFYSNQPLGEMESKLNNYLFYKTSRSYIVNLTKVKMIKPRSRTSFNIYFDTTKCRAVLSALSRIRNSADNGSIYSSNHLQSVCGRLGIHLSHTRGPGYGAGQPYRKQVFKCGPGLRGVLFSQG